MSIYDTRYINKCIIWDTDEPRGITWDNWSIPRWDDGDHRWMVDFSSIIPVFIEEFNVPYRLVDRPEKFTSAEYIKWVEENKFRELEHSDHMFTFHALDNRLYNQEFYMRCAESWSPYPGGYYYVVYHDYGEEHNLSWCPGRYFLLCSDFDDGVYNIYTDDKTKADEAWEVLSTMPDLTQKDVRELGLS